RTPIEGLYLCGSSTGNGGGTVVPFLIGRARGEGSVQRGRCLDRGAGSPQHGQFTQRSAQFRRSRNSVGRRYYQLRLPQQEIFAAFVAGWARQDPALKQQLLALSQGNLTPTQLQLLPAIYHEMGSEDTMVAGANLLRGTMSPFGRHHGLETQFLERQPHGRAGAFVLVPRNAEKACAEPFQAVLNDPSCRASAFFARRLIWSSKQRDCRPRSASRPRR